MKIFIFDLQFANYSGRSTPKPSATTMLISGYHKAKGDTVVFSARPPKNFALYDIVYINKDTDGLFHLQEWLDYPNVKAVGNFWENETVYYSEDWELTPPDITIYHEWITDFMKKFPSKNEKLFETFFQYTPFIMKQKGKIIEPSGDKILILDRNWIEWDCGFDIVSSLDIKRLRFAYPIPINYDYEKVCDLVYYCKNIDRNHLWLELYGLIPKEKQIEIAKEFKKRKLGRNVKIKWSLNFYSANQWKENLLPAMDMFETFLKEGNKYLFMAAPERLYIKDELYSMLWDEFQNWTLFRLKNTRNNLIDNLIFYSLENYDLIMEFLEDPYKYLAKGKVKGHKKLTMFISLLETDKEIVYELSKVQRAPVGVDAGYGYIKTDIENLKEKGIHEIFLPFAHNLFSNDLTAKKRIRKILEG